METIDNYFSEYESGFFKIGPTLAKRLDDSEKNIEYDLSKNNIAIWMISVIIPRFIPSFNNFISVPEEQIHIDNLKKLEGKLIFLEWSDNLSRKIDNATALNCIRIYDKKKDNIMYPREWDLSKGVIGKVFNSGPIIDPIICFEDYDAVYITEDKFSNYQHYEKDGKKWKFKWKIWLPEKVYYEVFGHKRKKSPVTIHDYPNKR